MGLDQLFTYSNFNNTASIMPRAALLFLLAFMGAIHCALGESQVYVVHMDKSKMEALDQSLEGSKRWFDSLMESLAQLESDKEDEELGSILEAPQLIYAYETTLTGFSAKLTPNQLKRLQTLDGFLHASPDEFLSLHTTHSPQFLGLHPYQGLWSDPGLASDVIVGIVDTGVWPEHVSFRDAGLSSVPAWWKGKCEQGTKFSTNNCNKKLIGAKAFYKGYEAVAGKLNVTVDYQSARDSSGHGTHTASTAAGGIVPSASLLGLAKGVARGMSYTARVAAYKVCWSGGCASTDILAAIDEAVADGVEVLSLSLGGPARPYYADNMAAATFGAAARGVVVVCSAGNSGPSESTVSNNAPWVMTVAASSLDRSFSTTVRLGDGRTFAGESLYSGQHTKQLSLVYGVTAAVAGRDDEARYCLNGTLSPKLVKGKMVVCDRGMNGRAEKGEQVKLVGGAAMLLLNTPTQGEELLLDAHFLPTSSLGAAAGEAVRSYAETKGKKKSKEAAPTAKIVFHGTVYGRAAPAMAAFSSRGPNPISPEVLKPDLTAPGVNILAAWPPAVGPTGLKSDERTVAFNILSGTSMSCPHVSGLAALLRSVHREWSPAAIKSALMTTAYTINNHRSAISESAGESSDMSPATPFAFGSGHVNPEKAVNPGLIYDIATEDYLDFLCSLNYTSEQISVLAKGGHRCSNKENAGDLNYPSITLSINGGKMEKPVTKTVTNVGPAGKYVVRVRPPAGVSVTVEPSVLEFQEVGEKKSYSVRFAAEEKKTSGYSFGELVWECGDVYVRSSIAVIW